MTYNVFSGTLNHAQSINLSPHTKWHLDRFILFCTAHSRMSSDCTMGRPFPPSKFSLCMGFWTPI